MIVKRSAYGYVETTTALLEEIERWGLTVFARVDHAAAAREVGLQMASLLDELAGGAAS
jgi:uncharacterized protein (DUF302 family)